MDRECRMCGYRINPDTALRAGLVTRRDYDTQFALNPVLSWCEETRGWVPDYSSCASWRPYTEYDGEKKYRSQASS